MNGHNVKPGINHLDTLQHPVYTEKADPNQFYPQDEVLSVNEKDMTHGISAYSII
jgi:hypothetical protein